MTIEQVKRAHEDAGGHFFEPGTLRFFRTRIGQRTYVGPGGVYFTTSEQFVASDGWSPGRKYSVRRFDPENPSWIDTAGEFQQYESRGAAAAAARKLAQG